MVIFNTIIHQNKQRVQHKKMNPTVKTLQNQQLLGFDKYNNNLHEQSALQLVAIQAATWQQC